MTEGHSDINLNQPLIHFEMVPSSSDVWIIFNVKLPYSLKC